LLPPRFLSWMISVSSNNIMVCNFRSNDNPMLAALGIFVLISQLDRTAYVALEFTIESSEASAVGISTAFRHNFDGAEYCGPSFSGRLGMLSARRIDLLTDTRFR
jgi:hypothetical protein